MSPVIIAVEKVLQQYCIPNKANSGIAPKVVAQALIDAVHEAEKNG